MKRRDELQFATCGKPNALLTRQAVNRPDPRETDSPIHRTINSNKLAGTFQTSVLCKNVKYVDPESRIFMPNQRKNAESPQRLLSPAALKNHQHLANNLHESSDALIPEPTAAIKRPCRLKVIVDRGAEF